MYKLKLLIYIAFIIMCPFNIKAQVYKDVAPIFIANCTSCHHDGGIAFSLTSYSNILPMGIAVKTALQSNAMPPWPPDPSY